MPQFRKKPVVIDAFQWLHSGPDHNGDGWGLLDAWLVSLGYPPMDLADGDGDHAPMWLNTDLVTLTIPTLEGDHRCDNGDWIIRGIKGEFYPCKPDIFAATYEPVNESPYV
jgi:hypothetical protein